MPAFVAGDELADLADADLRIVVMTADLASANRLADFAARHPGRFFDLGIAEKNMITAAAGLASTGLIPFVGTFASFAALLGFEQIRTDCAYPGMPVRILAHHSGMSLGYYGTSHHALEDLAAMRAVADLTVACAADGNQLRAMLRASPAVPGAVYLRLGRGRDPEVYPSVPADFAFGRSVRLREGADATIIATGSQVHPALAAADLLAAEDCRVRVVDMHTIKPLDANAVLAAASETGCVVTVEEHSVIGGLGSAVAEVLVDHRVAVPFRRHGIADEYVLIGPPAALYAHYRFDPVGIAAVVQETRAEGLAAGQPLVAERRAPRGSAGILRRQAFCASRRFPASAPGFLCRRSLLSAPVFSPRPCQTSCAGARFSAPAPGFQRRRQASCADALRAEARPAARLAVTSSAASHRS